MILILGASGYIGNYLFKRFKEEGIESAGTYCKNEISGMLKFDLANMGLRDLNLEGRLSHMLIAAAANPRPDASKINSEESHRINVERTKVLLDECFEKKIIPIYISTDNVFDGEKGNYREEDRTNPLNLYGKMKCEIESHLFQSEGEYLLLRFGKSFKTEMGDPTLFTNMQSGNKLKLATDQVFTPLYLEDLFEFVREAVKSNYKGIFHLTSIHPTNRYEIATTTRDFFKMGDVEIIPCSIDSLNLTEGGRPKLISLNSEKYQQISGKKEKSVIDFLRQISVP